MRENDVINGLLTSKMENETPIQKFYRGRSVFITGGTGFCGKVLVEKLLRACPGIEKIYILIRPKKSLNASQRLKLMLSEPVFTELNDSTTALSKLEAISGDISLPELGISIQDKQLLCDTVSIVFHVAATVRFNENLKEALKINVWGTRTVISLCKEIKELKAVVYLSTAYSHCPLKVIEEKFYSPPVEPEFLSTWLEHLTEYEVAIIETQCLGKWPNTYSYTKALAEYIIERQKSDLPVVVCRPSIVISTWKEPVAGWIDSFSGPTLAIPGISLGKMRCGLVSKNKKVDVVPVDMLANAMIAISWDTARSFISNADKSSQSTVYNFVSGDVYRMTWGRFFTICAEYIHKFPSRYALWYSTCWLFNNRMVYEIMSFLTEFTPSILLDTILYIRGKNVRHIKQYNKSRTYLELVSFFSNREWTFQNKNTKALLKKLSPEDSKLFDFNVQHVKWREYLKDYVIGIRTYIQKEKMNTLASAKKRYLLLTAIHHISQLMMLYGVYGLLQTTFKYIFSCD